MPQSSDHAKRTKTLEEAPKRGRRATLSRGQILRAAMELVRRKGGDALTMRAVADQLGTGTMSLYSHVQGKEDLVEGVAALAFERLTVELDPKGHFTARLTSWMHSLRRELKAHPEIIVLIAKHNYGSPQLLRTFLLAAEILADAGFSVRRAAEIAQILLWSAMGFFMLESGQEEALGSKAREIDAELATAVASMSERDGQAIERFLPFLATNDFDALYDTLVRQLMAGLDAEFED